MRSLYLGGFAIAAAFLLIAPGLICQDGVAKQSARTAGEITYIPHMVFDVASIRESGDNEGNWSYVDNPSGASYYQTVRVPAVTLLLGAYSPRSLKQLENVPGWMMTTRLDVTAKGDAALAKLSEADGLLEKHHMVQVLLAERFKLRIHEETRDQTTYELYATPRTARMMTAVSGDPVKLVGSCDQKYSGKGIEVASRGCRMRQIVNILVQDLGTTVVDRTGMTGIYAYDMMWIPSDWRRFDVEHYPGVLEAVREQLGLQVRKTKGPVTYWVIDHIERPTAN